MTDPLTPGIPLRQLGVAAARRRPPVTGTFISTAVRAATDLWETTLTNAGNPVRFAVASCSCRPSYGVLVHVHGGGWALGEAAEFPDFRRLLAHETTLVVLSPEYPLAPEAPFPQGLNAVQRALAAVLEALPGEVPVYIGGDSSGGNLATVAARQHAAAGGRHLTGQLLAYPVTDARLDRSSHQRHGGLGAVLTVDDLAWFWEQYVGDSAWRSHPDASPLSAEDLHLLPPTLILLAGNDPLLDEGNAYAAALAKAGVDVFTHVYEGEEHGFLTRPGLIPGAADAIADMASWIGTLRLGRPTLAPHLARILFPPALEGGTS